MLVRSNSFLSCESSSSVLSEMTIGPMKWDLVFPSFPTSDLTSARKLFNSQRLGFSWMKSWTLFSPPSPFP